MIKLLVFDVDGTLLDNELNKFNLEIMQAIAKAKEAGVRVLLATGRFLDTIDDELIQAVDADGFVTYNGNLTLNQERQVIDHHPLPTNHVTKLVDYLRSHNRDLAIETDAGIIFQSKAHIYDALKDVFKFNYAMIVDANFDSQAFDVYCVMAHLKQHHLDGAIDLNLGFKYERFDEGLYDLYNQNITKVTGIEVFLNQWNLSWNNVMAFGDSTNDIDMLMKAKHSFVVHNNKSTLDHLDLPRISHPLSDDFKQVIDAIINM